MAKPLKHVEGVPKGFRGRILQVVCDYERKGTGDPHHVRIIGRNRQIIASTESYVNLSNAMRSARTLARNMMAPVVIVRG